MTGNSNSHSMEVVYLLIVVLMASTIAVVAGTIAAHWYGG